MNPGGSNPAHARSSRNPNMHNICRTPAFALWLILALALIWPQTSRASEPDCCGPITAQGQKLLNVLDQSGVEHLWLPQVHVHWLSGEPDLRRPGRSRHATHCSAYVAAMSVRLGVPLLRPPQRRAGMLATPQAHWLGSIGKREGWVAVDMQQAQSLANQGQFLLAAWANPDPRRSGHIAIVRPSEQSTTDLRLHGPELTMAGHLNALRISTAHGFEDHKGAWQEGGKGSVQYFAHPVDWAVLNTSGTK